MNLLGNLCGPDRDIPCVPTVRRPGAGLRPGWILVGCYIVREADHPPGDINMAGWAIVTEDETP